MFDVTDRTWITKSAVAASADADIVFSLSPAFHPDPNALDEMGAIALPAPLLASAEPYSPSSNDVFDNEQELAHHYKDVLKLARQHGQSYNEFSRHMWLRLHFEWTEGVIGFPWYDTLDGMEVLFDWLNDAADGDTWSDLEQGWEMIAVRLGPRLHFREGGFDQGGEYANVALPRDDLLVSISRLRERMHLIIGRLTAEIGEDYWTHYRYDLLTGLT